MSCDLSEVQLRDWIARGAPELDEHLATCSRCREIVARLGAASTVSQTGITGRTPASAHSMPATIGHYRLKRVIASGGMGTTYEALQEHPRRTVAVKVMKPGIASPVSMRRFEQESQILARLRHPNIVQVFEAGVEKQPGPDGDIERTPYFAMEYIPNAKSITSYARQENLGTRQRVEMFVKVCDAMQHGHTKGVIHRDVKPSNLLVDSSGEPRIIDFGIARTTDADLAVTTQQTNVGQLVGTLLYMSPEQYAGDPHDLDARSDVYGLGVVLYELVTGELPYVISQTTLPELARVIREAAPTPPSRVYPSIDADLEVILVKALHKDRQRRYQSAMELRGDLQRYLDGEPIHARGDSVAYVASKRLQRSVRRHPIGWWVAAVAAAFLISTFLGVRLVYRWTSLNNVYERFATAAVAPTPETGAFRTVRVIIVNDDTDIAALAAAEGLEVVTAANPRSFRSLYGRMAEKLADSGARVVGFDIYFPTATVFDEDFVAGIRALHARGIDVVVARKRWLDRDHDEYPGVTPTLARAVRYGGITAGFSEKAPWRVHLALQRGDAEPMNAFSTVVVGAYFEPGRNVLADLHVEEAEVELSHYTTRPDLPHERVPTGQTRWIKVTSIDREGDRDEQQHRFEDDLFAHYTFDMPADGVLRASTIAIEDVFAASPGQLREWFGDRIVLVQNTRDGRDLFAHPSGRKIVGVYGHACAIDTIVNELSAHRRLGHAGESTLAGAIAGGLIGVWLARRHAQRVALIALIAAVALVGSVWAQREFQWLGNPMVPVLAMFIASELTAAARRLRAAIE